MNTILVPVDGSDHAMKALLIACDLAAKYDGRIALLHVMSAGRGAREVLALRIAESFDPALKTALRARVAAGDTALPVDLMKRIGSCILDRAAERVTRRGIEVKPLDLESGEAAESILIARTRTGASTIVMGCRGAGASDGSTFGSVSQTVFQRADCTCISVK